MSNKAVDEGREIVKCDSKQTVEQFIEALNAGSDKWVLAGEILVTLRNEDEQIFDKICHAYPFVSVDMLEIFLSIGIKSLHPLALLLPRHVFNYVQLMKYESQASVMVDNVEIVTRLSGDKPVIVRKAVSKLTPDECKRVLFKKGIRTVEKQVSLLSQPAAPTHQAFAPSVNKPPVERVPKEVARYAVSRGAAGTWRFEKTMARSFNEHRVRLEHGQAIVVLTEFTD